MKKRHLYALAISLILPSLGFSAEHTDHADHKDHASHAPQHQEAGVEALSSELRGLLSEEMKALQNGMVSIIPSYVSGNWDEIATTAAKMQNSYILKQRLSKEQMEELHHALPPRFIEMDQNFHYLAGMLSHAAVMKKPELVNFYFSEMNQACQSCHSQFAQHKFPAFAPTRKKVQKEDLVLPREAAHHHH